MYFYCRTPVSIRQKVRRIRPIMDGLESREMLAASIWADLAALPQAQTVSEVALLPNGNPIVVGGNTGSETTPAVTSDVSSYDRTLGQWQDLASLPEPLSGAGVVSLPNGLVLAIGGREANDQPSNNLYAYNAHKNAWSELAAMPTARANAGSTALSLGRVIVVGGQNNATGETLDTVEIYDSRRNLWYIAAPLPEPLTNVEVVTLPSGQVMAMGGRNELGDSVNTVQIYDPVSNTWTGGVNLPESLDLGASVYAGSGIVLYIGGDTTVGGVVQSVSDTVYQYNVHSRTWTTTTAMPEARGALGAVVSRSGSVYAIGGRLADGTLTDATTIFTTPHSADAKWVYSQRFVNQVYLDTTGSSPNDAQLQYVTQKVASGAMTTGEVAWKLLGTSAGINQTISDIYLRVLNRGPNQAESDHWNFLMRQGDATPLRLEHFLLSSDDFYNQAGSTNGAYVSALSTLLTGTDDPATDAQYVAQLDDGGSRSAVATEWILMQDSMVYLLDDFSNLYTGTSLTTGQQANALGRIRRGGFGPYGVRAWILGSKTYWDQFK